MAAFRHSSLCRGNATRARAVEQPANGDLRGETRRRGQRAGHCVGELQAGEGTDHAPLLAVTRRGADVACDLRDVAGDTHDQEREHHEHQRPAVTRNGVRRDRERGEDERGHDVQVTARCGELRAEPVARDAQHRREEQRARSE